MDSYGFLWIPILSAPMDSHRIPMESYVFLWIPMHSYGFLWFPVDSSLNSMDFLELSQLSIESARFLWIPIVQFLWAPIEFLWIPMDSLEWVWIPVELLAHQSRITPA